MFIYRRDLYVDESVLFGLLGSSERTYAHEDLESSATCIQNAEDVAVLTGIACGVHPLIPKNNF